MKRCLLILIPVLVIGGCQSRNSFTVRGVIRGESNGNIYLSKVEVNILTPVDSAKIGKDGTFRFRVKATEPDFYQVGYSSSDFVTLLAQPGEKIKLEFSDKEVYKDYSVTGSAESEKVRMLDMRLNAAKRKLDSLRSLYSEASGRAGFDQKGPQLETEFTNTLKELRKRNIEFILKNIRSMASIKALYQKIDDNTYVLYDPHDLQFLKIVSDSLGKYYPDSRNVLALKEDVKKELSQMYADRISSMASNAPEKKLDPNLPDINGNRIALSSLKGKVVLLAFWSAQSKECITENLQLKKFYKAYNKQGFEIYQISLDQDENLWRREVRFDELPWINTREDPRNSENAILFNVKSVPVNYLYDRDGQIIASNLHGRSLQIKLTQLFPNK
ncbi:MAG: TlpA disulfide reductase family protein [Bacteroidales bacterium]